MIQASDEKIAAEMNLIGEANIKVESEEFCDANEDQANYEGMRWIIICFSTILVLYRFYYLFQDYIFIIISLFF